MRMLLIILVLLFSWTNVVALPAAAIVYGQKRGEERRKKDTPGPPVVKDKGKDAKPKEPPKRGKKPD